MQTQRHTDIIPRESPLNGQHSSFRLGEITSRKASHMFKSFDYKTPPVCAINYIYLGGTRVFHAIPSGTQGLLLVLATCSHAKRESLVVCKSSTLTSV